MSAAPWPRVKALFQAAVERPAADRAAFLTVETADDDALRREVESLLASDTSDLTFLDQLPVAREVEWLLPRDGGGSAFPETQAFTPPGAAEERTLAERRFGSYSILELLGAGGMGEVYRAHDEQLGRDVAIKILHRHYSSDPERLARFENEARMLAALNHPNIGAIYGHEHVDGGLALVLELVEGQTLAEHLAQQATSTGPDLEDKAIRRGLPVDKALHIARQIAEALEAAHKRGIVHRDLKPENIKITPDGVVKVLDFGLAKLGSGDERGSGAAPANSPTVTARETRAGVILGTAAYMSPEQATGKAADKRSDIWAFGVVLLEMLAGRAAVGGQPECDVLQALPNMEPDWSRLPTGTPPTIRGLLLRCLEKHPVRRLDSAAVARRTIDDALTMLAREAPGPVPGLAKHRGIWAVTVASLAGIALVTTGVVWKSTSRAHVGLSRFEMKTTSQSPLNVASTNRDFDVSRDGRHLVYRYGGTQTGGSPLMARAIDAGEPWPLSGIEKAYAPFFSPDGQSVGFFEGSFLKSVSFRGGPIKTLCPVNGGSLGASWGDDDTIVFATDDPKTGLWRVEANGGEASELTDPAATQGLDHVFPSILPGARAVLFTLSAPNGSEKAKIAILDLGTRQWQMLGPEGSQPEYVGGAAGAATDGYLIYAAAGGLRAVGFDPIGVAVRGDPVTLPQHVMVKPRGATNYAVSEQGTLVYVVAAEDPKRSLVWVDRHGDKERIEAPLLAYGEVRIAPDGTSAVVAVQNAGLRIWNFAQKRLTFLTDAPRMMDGMPVWTPDGKQIIFMSNRNQADVLGLYVVSADGSGTAKPIPTLLRRQWPTSILAREGGLFLFGFDGGSGKQQQVIGVHLPNPPTLGDGTPVAVTNLFPGVFAEVSPNGRFVAYRSATGTPEVYVRPFPVVDGPASQIVRISEGATGQVWARDGSKLFYLDASRLLTEVSADTSGQTFTHGSPTRLLDTRYVSPRTNPARHYDVGLDGRFLMLDENASDENVTSPSMFIERNWLGELKERVPDSRAHQ